MSHHINLTRIKGVAHALSDLKDEIAFVGGATVSLYVDTPEYIEVRPTEDIDVLIEILSYNAYAQLQEKLSALGFELDKEAKITCRYIYQGLIVDIMPLEENVLGFSNRWYKEGFEHLELYPIIHGPDIRIFPAAYFIACKLEAFHGRGKGDGRTSKDFEDIIFILDNRESIWADLKKYERDVFQYIQEQFSKLLSLPYIEEWISAHLEPATANKRVKMIRDGMRRIVEDKS